MLEHLTRDHYRLAVLALSWAGCAVNELPDAVARVHRDGLARFIIAADRDAVAIPNILVHLFGVAAAAAHCRREAKADEPASAGLGRMVAYLDDTPKADVVEMLSRFMSEVWARVTPEETDKCVQHFEENVFPKFAMYAPHMYGGVAH